MVLYNITNQALEEYCLLSEEGCHDRHHYKNFPGVKDSLAERFTQSLTAKKQDDKKESPLPNIILEEFSKIYKMHFVGTDPVKISQDRNYGYVYRENGERKLLSVFSLEDFLHKRHVLQTRRQKLEQMRIARHLRETYLKS